MPSIFRPFSPIPCSRVENLKDLVLYRFGSTGVVQVLSRAAELLGLVPVFPVRNVHTFASGATGNAVFRDCVLVNKYAYQIRYLKIFKANFLLVLGIVQWGM